MLPGRLAGFVHDLEHLPILDRVHHGEEAVVRIRDQLAPGDQAREGLLDELVAGLDQVDDLATEDEEAAVDADGRTGSCPRPRRRSPRRRLKRDAR